jgi:hypothetical protein
MREESSRLLRDGRKKEHMKATTEKTEEKENAIKLKESQRNLATNTSQVISLRIKGLVIKTG